MDSEQDGLSRSLFTHLIDRDPAPALTYWWGAIKRANYERSTDWIRKAVGFP